MLRLGSHVQYAEIFSRKSREMVQFLYRNAERTTLVCMERNIFKDIKAVVADNEPAFQSNKLRIWAKQRVVELCFPAPYHLESLSR